MWGIIEGFFYGEALEGCKKLIHIKIDWIFFAYTVVLILRTISILSRCKHIYEQMYMVYK